MAAPESSRHLGPPLISIGDVQTPVDLVIFDCDGVLVDTERRAVGLNSKFFRDHGHPLDEDTLIKMFIGQSVVTGAQRVAEFFGADGAEEWRARFRELNASELIDPVPGVIEAIKSMPYARCVASSNQPHNIRHSLDRAGLLDFFDGYLFSAAEVPRGKPFPDLFLHAAATMGVAPAACVVVEDSEAGVRAARAAGMHVFAYAGGVTPAHWLAGPGTTVFDDMLELPDLVAAYV
jgi:HAD superfamily hydrolase (TIGR01509 family)